ncbi:MAG: isopeptide-forming domain-containing fimbrial protein, partial [Myxococcota bacterium]
MMRARAIGLGFASILCASVAWAGSGATPTLTPGAPVTVPQGGQAELTFTVSNPGAETGLEPVIQLVLPPGYSFANGSSVGQGLDVISTIEFDEFGEALDPTTGATLTNLPGARLVILLHPLGNLRNSMGILDVVIRVNVPDDAEPSTTFDIESQLVFALGCPTSSAPVAQGFVVTTHTIADPPPPVRLVKSGTPSTPANGEIGAIGADIPALSEWPTGENYTVDYALVVDVDEDRDATVLDLLDCLPDETFVLPDDTLQAGDFMVMLGGVMLVEGVDYDYSTFVDGMGQRCVSFDLSPTVNALAPYTGVAADDLVVTYSGFGRGGAVDVAAGGSTTATNTVDSNVTLLEPDGGADEVFALTQAVSTVYQDFAVTKRISDGGADGYTPGELLTYEVGFFVSDHAGLQSIVLTDVLSDGLEFDVGAEGTLSVQYGDGSTATVSSIDLPSRISAAPAGALQLTLDVSAVLSAAGESPIVAGSLDADCAAASLPACSTETTSGAEAFGVFSYPVRIAREYRDPVNAPAGTVIIDGGDPFSNSARVDA